MFFENKKIKNIIFDLGGVLLNIEYNETVAAFERLGVHRFSEKYSQASQSNLFDRLETGTISPNSFRDELRQQIKINLSDAEIDNAWNALLKDFPQHRVDFLKKVKLEYRTFLLSNTNIIHFKAYSQIIKRDNCLDNMKDLFEETYLSHEISMRKPDKEIFDYVIKKNKLIPEETLFIDDSIQHVLGARSCGINSHHLLNKEDVVNVINHL